MIVAGGGAKNPTLLRMLRERLPDTEIKVYEFLQEKEAMAHGADRERLDLRPRHERRLGAPAAAPRCSARSVYERPHDFGRAFVGGELREGTLDHDR